MAALTNTQISLLVSFLLIIALVIKFAQQAESSTQQVDSSAIQPTFASPDKSFLTRGPAFTPPESSKENNTAVLHPPKQQVPSKPRSPLLW